MSYKSTRGSSKEKSSSIAILRGIAEDGGLYIPEEIPKINKDLQSLISYSYQELALYVLSLFFPEFSQEDLKTAISDAYDKSFSTPKITPITKVEEVFFLELFHGPTLAFKDIALTLLPKLIKLSANRENSHIQPVVLTATSGDTGKAALQGFAGAEEVKIIVFYPEDGVSPIQKLQMITQEGNNAFVIGIKGNFDDAQRGVKELFKDETLKEKLKSKGYFFTSANSINIGRLIPQVVYYFYSYLSLLSNKEISLGEEINFAVPTGNFGDILAGYYAKAMGLPINKLICASNENNVLYDFFNTGIYDARRNLKVTSSPSMDILVSSNLERLLYEVSGRDSIVVNSLMEELAQKGFYKITDEMRKELKDFYSGYSVEEEVSASIADLYSRTGYLMDTHTAVAYSVFNKYKEIHKDNTKTIILSTASPFKFSNALCRALSIDFSEDDIFSASYNLSEATGISIPRAIAELKEKDILHKDSCTSNEMKTKVQNILHI